MTWSPEEDARFSRVESAVFDVQTRSERMDTALLGLNGQGGLVKTVAEHEISIKRLEKAEDERKGRNAVIWAALSLGSAAIGTIVTLLAKYLSG